MRTFLSEIPDPSEAGSATMHCGAQRHPVVAFGYHCGAQRRPVVAFGHHCGAQRRPVVAFGRSSAQRPAPPSRFRPNRFRSFGTCRPVGNQGVCSNVRTEFLY
jgi:hypothetical protein